MLHVLTNIINVVWSMKFLFFMNTIFNLTRGGAINGVLGDILPILFLEHASTDFNENSHGSNQTSDVEFGYFNFFDKALRPDLWQIFQKLSFFGFCP